MGYHHWLKRDVRGAVVEITIRDDGGGKLDTFKFVASDKKTIRKVVKTLKEKYNIDFIQEMKEREKDLEWLE